MAEVAVEGIETQLEGFRRELNGYCYRLLGSVFEAEDAVQETMLRAWRHLDGFEGRSSLRTWLYRIAGNVCFDMLASRKRRAMPVDLSPAGSVESPLDPPLTESTWIEPAPDTWALDERADPADRAVAQESIRLAFIAALQHLPPRQRAVLILREVLAWQATEVAELLDTTVASVNSALQRARAGLAARGLSLNDAKPDNPEESFLDRYVTAFESYDVEALTALIQEDATQSMPPYSLWLSGRDEILRWWLGPGASCRDSRLVVTAANGSIAFGQYRVSPTGGRDPWALQLFEMDGGRISEFTFFLDATRLFPLFGLPLHLDD